jgi:hypothetical protein
MPAPNAAYNGPAPEPSRSIALRPQDVNDTTVGEAAMNSPTIVDPTGLKAAGQGPPRVSTSEPPADPAGASDIAELKARVGELVQALGAQNQLFEQRMAEREFELRAQMASMNRGSNVPVLPQGVDPEQPVTLAVLTQALALQNQAARAQTIRAVAGITTQEESAVMTRYPYLLNVAEPEKSELIREAVSQMRAREPQNGAGRTPSNGTPSVQSEQRVTRPASRAVPDVERTVAVSEDEPAPVNHAAQLAADYAATDKIPDKTARLKAKKAVYLKARAVLGLSDEEFAKMDWVQR